jgi:hypothetical protein
VDCPGPTACWRSVADSATEEWTWNIFVATFWVFRVPPTRHGPQGFGLGILEECVELSVGGGAAAFGCEPPPRVGGADWTNLNAAGLVRKGHQPPARQEGAGTPPRWGGSIGEQWR